MNLSHLLRMPLRTPRVFFRRKMCVNFNRIGLTKYNYFDERRIMNTLEMENNLAYRNLPLKEYKLEVMKQVWPIFQKHLQYRKFISRLRKQLYTADVQSKSAQTTPTQTNYANQNKNLHLNYEVEASTSYYEYLENFMFNMYFSLPNRLHEKTPKDDKYVVVHASSDPPERDTEHHLTVGETLNVLQYNNPTSYYLLNEAAQLELAVTRYFSSVLQNDHKFVPFCNPDLCTELIATSISYNTVHEEYIALGNKDLHLQGGASLSSFCAFRAGRSCNRKFLPERHFTCGRHYTPQPLIQNDGLYSVIQDSMVKLILTTETTQQMNDEFAATLEILRSFYEKMQLNFRICYQPASTLSLSESLRASIQLYSVRRNEYVQVAYLSIYDDFVSQRLRILSHDKKSNLRFAKIIEGTAVSSATLLAYLLEHSHGRDKLLVPECLAPYLYS